MKRRKNYSWAMMDGSAVIGEEGLDSIHLDTFKTADAQVQELKWN
jgi:hypothetical protein